MPTPNATISGGRNPEAARIASESMTRDANPPFNFTGNANMRHEVKYLIYIFNVSDVEQRIERPWVNFNDAGRGRVIIVPAREEGQRVSKPYKINDIVQVPLRNESTRSVQTIGQTGEFLAQDAINPEDPTGNWKTLRKNNAAVSINEGTNLYHWGLFWTRNEKPTDEEINAAVQRLEDNYNRLITEAKNLWAMGEKGRAQIGFTHRHAASYFNLEFEWNVLYRSQRECPGCSKTISTTAVICQHCNAILDEDKARKLYPERYAAEPVTRGRGKKS